MWGILTSIVNHPYLKEVMTWSFVIHVCRDVQVIALLTKPWVAHRYLPHFTHL